MRIQRLGLYFAVAITATVLHTIPAHAEMSTCNGLPVSVTPETCTLYVQAERALQESKYQSAAQLFTGVIKRAPHLYVAYVGRAIAYFQLSRYRDAAPDLRVALPRFPALRLQAPTSAHVLMQTTHISQGSAVTAYIGGLEAYVFGDSNQALSLMERTNILDPHLTGPYYFLAMGLLDAGLPKQTVQELQTALYLDPHSALSLKGFGELYSQTGDYRKSLHYYTASIAADPSLEATWVNRGVLRLHMGDAQGAYVDETHAIALDPADPYGYIDRADAAGDLSRYQQDLADGNMAVRLGPQIPAAWQTRAVARSDLHDYTGEIADATQAIKLFPQYAEAYNDRASAEQALGQRSAALADYGLAIRFDPTAADIFINRCSLYIDMGRFPTALVDCRRAISLDGKSPAAYREYGRALYALHDNAGARAAWEQAKKLYLQKHDVYDAQVVQGYLARL